MAFHEHLDGCSRCRNNPFDLCDEGSKLLAMPIEIRCGAGTKRDPYTWVGAYAGRATPTRLFYRWEPEGADLGPLRSDCEGETWRRVLCGVVAVAGQVDAEGRVFTLEALEDIAASNPEVYFVKGERLYAQSERGMRMSEELQCRLEVVAEIEQLRLNLEGSRKANVQLKEDLRLESAAYKVLRAKLEEWQERAARDQGETIRLLRDKAFLERKLLRAHEILLNDLDVLYPDPDVSVEQLKARLLRDVQDYSGLGPLLGLLGDGETLTLEHGGRATLCRFGEVIAIGSATVEALLFSRSRNVIDNEEVR